MEIDRVPDEYLCPLHFLPNLDSDTGATGPESPLWEGTEVDRRERYGSATRGLWLRVNSDLCEGGITEPETLNLHLGGVTVGSGDGLSNFARCNIGIITGVETDGTPGEQFQLRLTRTDAGETAGSGPGISVEDVQVQEAEGAALAFRVSLDDAETSVVSIRYRGPDGPNLVRRLVAGLGERPFGVEETRELLDASGARS